MRTDYSEFQPVPADWAVLNTHPHKEPLALDNLLRQSFSPYCPMVRKRVKHGRRYTDVLRPMFPGYVFVQLAPERQMWRPLLSTYGVRRMIRFGERPALLADGFVQALRAREIEGAISRPAERVQVGDRVVLAGGAFDGLVATILSMDEKSRLVVLLDMLNRPVKVKVEARHIGPLAVEG